MDALMNATPLISDGAATGIAAVLSVTFLVGKLIDSKATVRAANGKQPDTHYHEAPIGTKTRQGLHKLDELESDLAEVKTDVAVTKADVGHLRREMKMVVQHLKQLIGLKTEDPPSDDAPIVS